MKAKKHVGAWVIIGFWFLGLAVVGGVLIAKHGGENLSWIALAFGVAAAIYLIFFRKAKKRDYEKDYTKEDLKP